MSALPAIGNWSVCCTDRVGGSNQTYFGRFAWDAASVKAMNMMESSQAVFKPPGFIWKLSSNPRTVKLPNQ